LYEFQKIAKEGRRGTGWERGDVGGEGVRGNRRSRRRGER
jgi:hypothetical protein